MGWCSSINATSRSRKRSGVLLPGLRLGEEAVTGTVAGGILLSVSVMGPRERDPLVPRLESV